MKTILESEVLLDNTRCPGMIKAVIAMWFLYEAVQYFHWINSFLGPSIIVGPKNPDDLLSDKTNIFRPCGKLTETLDKNHSSVKASSESIGSK